LICISFVCQAALPSPGGDAFRIYDQLFLRTNTMKALQDLFSTDYGLMSVVVIGAIIAVSVGAYVVLKSKMAESAKNAGKS